MAELNDTYVVHTATVTCTKGMRPSCAVLDNTHGIYLRQQPQMTVYDSSGTKNLVCFGGCYSMENPDTVAEAERIQREVQEESPDTFLDKVMNFFTGGKKKAETHEAQEGVPRVVGKCTPNIPFGEKWDNGKDSVKTKGQSPLLGGAKLHCLYGGEIEIIDSGQSAGGKGEAAKDAAGKNNIAGAKDQLKTSIKMAVDSYMNVGQQIATMPFMDTEEALDAVLSKNAVINSVSDKYDIEKEMIQSILFQEQRFYNILDPVADSMVKQSHIFERQMEQYENTNVFLRTGLGVPKMPIMYRDDSSTGPGQIFASTAIDATNWYEGTNYDRTDKKDLELFWNNLQDEDYNIDMVGRVLAYKRSLLHEGATAQEIMRAYNGSGTLAEKYSEVAIQYYEAFKEYNSVSGKLEKQK